MRMMMTNMKGGLNMGFKNSLVGLVLLVSVGCSNCGTTKETLNWLKDKAYFDRLTEEAERDTLQLDLQDLIDIPLNFDIQHFTMVPLHPTDTTLWALYGHTNYERRKILLNDEIDYNVRRLVILHEYIHVLNKFKRPWVELSEDQINARSYITFKRYFPRHIHENENSINTK